MSGDAILFRNARIWVDPSVRESVITGDLLSEEGRVAACGTVPEGAAAQATEVVEAAGRLIIPGLIQTHVHLCQTLMRGLAEDVPLLEWLRRYIWPLEAAHTRDSLRVSALLGCASLIRSGTTAVMTFETVRHTDVAFEVLEEVGLMGHISHCLMDETGGYPSLAVPLREALNDCERILERWGGNRDLRLAIAPRFALSSSSQNLREAVRFARERGLLLHTHAAEQEEEVLLVQERTGLGNVEYLDSLGLLGPDVCLTHCVHVQPEEVRRIAETETRVIHCPSANLKLGSGIAPITEFLKSGILVSLGADGAPCNNRLDAFTEMRTAALLQKIRSDPAALPPQRVVEMATVGGARTLGWEGELGVLRAGARANLVMLDRSWQVEPGADPAVDVVYGHSSEDVCLTMVNGRILYRDGRLRTIDEEWLRKAAGEERRKLMQRAGLL